MEWKLQHKPQFLRKRITKCLSNGVIYISPCSSPKNKNIIKINRTPRELHFLLIQPFQTPSSAIITEKLRSKQSHEKLILVLLGLIVIKHQYSSQNFWQYRWRGRKGRLFIKYRTWGTWNNADPFIVSTMKSSLSERCWKLSFQIHCKALNYNFPRCQ